MTTPQNESSVSTFVRAECLLEDNAVVSQPELFERWAAWCRQNNQGSPGDIASFERELMLVEPTVSLIPLTFGAQIRFFGRIRLLTDAELLQRQPA